MVHSILLQVCQLFVLTVCCWAFSPVDFGNPVGKLARVGDCGRKENKARLLGHQYDALLPHHAPLFVPVHSQTKSLEVHRRTTMPSAGIFISTPLTLLPVLRLCSYEYADQIDLKYIAE